jgi:hypothetical protein
MLLSAEYREVFRRHALDPEKRLMLAILEDAVKCFQAWAGGPSESCVTAEAWILRDDPEWPFSFDNVCEFLEIDPYYLRSGLVRWKNTKPDERVAQFKRLTESTGRRRRR